MRFAFLLLAAILLAACAGGQAATPATTPTQAIGQTAEATVQPTEVAASPTETPACDAIIRSAIERVGETCDMLGRNEACYGNTLVEAEFREDVEARFSEAGDIVALTSLRRLQTLSLNEPMRQWGVAVIKAQANLPGSLPGQNVTFLLYGDARMDDPTPDMQAVKITTGIGRLECEEAPESAALVQSPEGTVVTMSINGAEVMLGSTVHIRAVTNDAMTLATIEGSAVVTAFGESQMVLPGLQVSIPMGEDAVTGPPSEPEPFDVDAIASAPIALLEREVVVPPPAEITPEADASDTPAPAQTQHPTATACAPREEWTDTVTIAEGESLTDIAQRYGITESELAAANCLDRSQVQAGDVLRVPVPPTSTPGREAATPTGDVLTADATSIASGECTTLRWDVAAARQVFFEGQRAPASDERRVCPTRTTTYTLIVVGDDGSQTPHRLTVTVE
nr:MAG: hypothetical protein DIU68_01320 [Chloroflexota bacterium]